MIEKTKIRMKHDWSTADGRIFIKDCYYAVSKELSEELHKLNLCYVKEVWDEDGVICKQYK